jgi:hypothetical protein
MNSGAIRNDVLAFLAKRRVESGESVEYGWFIFQTIIKDGQLDVETLDFKEMASFTSDFSAVERIHGEQMAVLRGEGVEPGWCVLWHCAIVSRSYVPGHEQAFVSRLDELNQNKSGWYVGVADDPLDVNDVENLCLRSLYELSIRDSRFTPYWLLPIGYLVEFNGAEPRLSRS